MDANSFLNPTAFPGVFRFRAVNGNDEAAFVTLDLVSYGAQRRHRHGGGVAGELGPVRSSSTTRPNHGSTRPRRPLRIQSVLGLITT
ncbi:MAG: hypothetical protein ACR2KK_18140 [Acidimicrobiales bacterium]